jgi:hypothetical protein
MSTGSVIPLPVRREEVCVEMTPAGRHGEAFAWKNKTTAVLFKLLSAPAMWQWTREAMGPGNSDSIRARKLIAAFRQLIEAEARTPVVGDLAFLTLRRVHWPQLVEQLVIFRSREELWR